MHVIGGGVIGLCSAWYLRNAGFDVTVIDQTEMHDGCSFGNSGLIVPSHSIPLASPGVVAQGVRWMFRSGSPFFINPRLSLDLLSWLWRFYRSCNATHVRNALPVLRDLHLLSKSLYVAFTDQGTFEFDLEQRGNLMLCRTAHGLEEEVSVAKRLQDLGLNISILSSGELSAADPGMHSAVRGGILYHDDAHFHPGKFILKLQAKLREAGVRFMTGRTVNGFVLSKDGVEKISFADGSSELVEGIVLAAGAWSGQISKQLGLRLLIQDGKGYSVTLSEPPMRPEFPCILTEARVAVTPMSNVLRIGGTLEVSNFSKNINAKRVNAILEAMTQYYHDFPRMTPDDVSVWYGYRPVSADGLPYIGRSSGVKNVIIATGHAMLGMSLGPATGMLVSEIAQGKQTSIPIDIFDPERHTG